jgi:Fic family protein
MTYIHEQTNWPNFTWDGETLAALLAAVRHKQGRLLGRMETLGFELRTEATLVVLTSEVVKSSAIEGEMLNPDEVRSSIARRLGLEVTGNDLQSGDRKRFGNTNRSSPRFAVEGVVEMMLDATRNFDAQLSRNRLFDWHAALFPTGRSGMGRITVGAWRTKESGPMRVVSGPMGREKVHLEAPVSERLDAEMDRFIDWFNERLNQPAPMDPVLKAGVAHLWFVTVHPYEDGNGRIARAIADMALARADGTQERFYSMSTQIEAERKDYYLQLETAQRGELNITRWLEWFLGCLQRAIDGADQILAAVLTKARLWQRINQQPVNDRQRLVINRMLNGFKGVLSTSKYAKLAGCSADTALRDIRELVDRGILIQNPGRGRSTSYRLADLESMRTDD